jgi:VanZ family protein
LIQYRLRRLWERPLRGLGGSWADVYSNIALFIPWGFLLAICLQKRGSSWWRTLLLAMITAVCLSGTVEFLQLFAPKRSISVVDLMTNTLGSVVGALVGWPLARWVWPAASVRVRQLVLARPAAACALLVGAVILFAGLSPSYDKLGSRGMTARLKTARLVPFGQTAGGFTPRDKACLWVAELLTWTLAGGVFAVALRESKRSGVRAIGTVAALAGGLSLIIEAIQLVIPGRDVDLTSVLLALLGSTLGASLMMRGARVEVHRWTIPALIVWGIAVTLAAWSPGRFVWPDRWELQPAMYVPFWSYFGSRTLEDLTDVVGQTVLFLPLGAILAVRSFRWSFPSVVLIGLAMGAILEVGQAFLPARSPDVSDAISAAAGAGFGLALWRFGESARTSSQGATRYRVGASSARAR